MKQTIKTVALLALLATAAAGCQKEDISSTTNTPTMPGVMATCTVDGVVLDTTLEWSDLLNRALDLAEQGHYVVIDQGTTDQQPATREVVTFNTPDRAAAYNWLDTMLGEGYTVHVYYDSEHCIYHCVAIR